MGRMMKSSESYSTLVLWTAGMTPRLFLLLSLASSPSLGCVRHDRAGPGEPEEDNLPDNYVLSGFRGGHAQADETGLEGMEGGRKEGGRERGQDGWKGKKETSFVEADELQYGTLECSGCS